MHTAKISLIFKCLAIANNSSQNNANEGLAFTPQNITTEDDFIDLVYYLMPQLSHEQVQQVLAQYALPAHLPTTRFATDGVNKDATAVFVSPFGVGQQQRANVMLL